MSNRDPIDEELKIKIAMRLKELRLQSGKMQKDIAHESGKDKQALSRLERGRGASIYSINKLCKVLEITLSEFFDSPIFD